MTARRRDQTLRTLALLAGACLLWPSSATAEDCGSPCTVTRAGLPTFRLVNTVDGAPNWDLETSAFGVELALASDNPRTGAFRVEHGANRNTLVLASNVTLARVGISTSVPALNVQINDTFPAIRLDDTSSGAGEVDLGFNENTFFIFGNSGAIASLDTRAPFTVLKLDENGRLGISTTTPQASLHVGGDARIDGDVVLGSSRSVKTALEPVSPGQILAKLTDLPIASWRYKAEDESARHLGPFAEDFQRLFGLGDGKTISVVDAQGVAFAAIQGLQERLAAKDAQIADLIARLAALEDRLDGR